MISKTAGNDLYEYMRKSTATHTATAHMYNKLYKTIMQKLLIFAKQVSAQIFFYTLSKSTKHHIIAH